MAKTTKAQTERRYRRLLAEQARSGLSVRAFAEKRGVPAGTLSFWRHELKRRDGARERGDKACDFVAVNVVESAAPFAPSTLGAGAYEVVIGREVVLRMPGDFDVARVAALVKAVTPC